MSRIRILHTTAVLIAGAVSLSLLLSDAALAQCTNADLCTSGECSVRQSVVHPTCDQPRSCASIAATDKAELRRRLAINQQCLLARLDVSACFSSSDPGHDQAIQAVRSTIALCQLKIDQN